MNRRLIGGLLLLLGAAVIVRPYLPAGPGWLGVRIEPAPGGRGVRIVEPMPGGPAAAAGLAAGDVITRLGDDEVADVRGFIARIAGSRPGESVDLTVRRDGRETSFKVRLGRRPRDLPDPSLEEE
jgi:S1-C subfamily serine protease